MAKAKVTEKNIKLILQGSMGKAILALAVPVVINSFLQTMYNLTDTYWQQLILFRRYSKLW